MLLKIFCEICDQMHAKCLLQASALVLALYGWGSGEHLRTPCGVQGQSPGGGQGGSAPGSSWILGVFEVKNQDPEGLHFCNL